VGGISRLLLSQGGFRGVATIFGDPPGWGLGAAPTKIFLLEKFLVKYCNFVVNMDCSLCHRSDDRSYVNLGSFPLQGNHLLYMRELYYVCVLF
jgi:hypothetical protein